MKTKAAIDFYYHQFSSPVGELFALSNGTDLLGLHFMADWQIKKSELLKRKIKLIENASLPILQKTEKQMKEYFSGKRKSFDLKINPDGTRFQKQAWAALMKIPYGKAISYSDQAKWAKSPKAVRAIGSANGRNPICIIIPCHRVIAANGSLGGYSGGLEKKKILLGLEGQTF